jgi:predicted kinase
MTMTRQPGAQPELVITRGLPASGKSSYGRDWVSVDPDRRARINRDLARVMLHGGPIGPAGERQVTTATHAAIRALLGEGVNVISDDTNLPDEHYQALADIGQACGARVRVHDLRGVPLAICLHRNAARTGDEHVDPAAIVRMHTEHVLPALAAGDVVPLAVDGTLTLHAAHRLLVDDQAVRCPHCWTEHGRTVDERLTVTVFAAGLDALLTCGHGHQWSEPAIGDGSRLLAGLDQHTGIAIM